MSFGLFDAALGSEVEVALSKQASVDKMAAAIYDVREKLGPVLFASRDLEEFNHKIAMMKEDQSLFKVIEASGLFPLPKIRRQVIGKLKDEFLQRLADSGSDPTMTGAPADPLNPMAGGPQNNPAPPEEGVDRGIMQQQFSTAMRKGAPFAGYEDFDDCTSKNSDKDDSDAYCGEIKHRTEDKKESRRRRADFDGTQDLDQPFEDHQGEVLKPKGDFKGYLKKMDQGAPEKVKRNFASKQAVARYRNWCTANKLSPVRLSSLDRYAANLSTAEYFRLANVILAWESEHHPKVPNTKLKAKDKVARQRQSTGPALQADPTTPMGGPNTHVVDILDSLGDPAEVMGPRHGRKWRRAANLHGYARSYLAWCRQHGLAEADPTNLRNYGRYTARVYPEGYRYIASALSRVLEATKHRYAAPDYLQKADDALTQLLNQKAEEFQQTIAPLQQALITVQQAAQLQQQQNPLNVLPTPGTVNVMPGAPDSTAGQLGMPDPNAPDLSGLTQMLQPGGGAMGGVAPQDGSPAGGASADAGAPPPAAAGGGLPPDLDQSAGKAARRQGKGRGAGRPRQAGGVGEQWDRWKKQRTDQGDALRGDEVDYQRFQQEHGVGERAMKNLRQRNQTPDFEPINGVQPSRPKKAPEGITVGNRRREACWPGCHENEAHAKKFHAKDKKEGQRKQAWSGWGPAVVPKTRHVAGWDWNDYQNGYLTNTPRHFECSCGDQFPTPSGFHRCACGKQWNSYVIGSGGGHKEARADQFIVREVPVRPDVIVANRKLASSIPTGEWNYEPGNKFPVHQPSGPSPHETRAPHRSREMHNPPVPKGGITDEFLDDPDYYHHPQGLHVQALIDPRTGNMHNLVDPGEVGEGKDPGLPTFRKQPKDWARRSGDGKWQGSAIG